MNAEQAQFLVGHYADTMAREFQTTCKVLAAVRDDTRDFKPDPKSRTAWELATHIATSDVWFLDSIIKGKFDMAAEGGDPGLEFKTVADVVAFYEKTFPEKLAQVRAMSAEDMTRIVDFMGFMQQPAVAYLAFANNHGIHHRGQLAAYLRAHGSKVPNIYGPSADAEPGAH